MSSGDTVRLKHVPETHMEKLSSETVSFGEFTLDLRRGCLLRSEAVVKLRPKAFEVLKHLVENNGRLISKDELIGTIWAGTAVTDDSLVQCLMEVRKALGDEGQRLVKTVPRRGYIFEAQVIEHDARRELIYTEEVEGVSLAVEEVTSDEPWVSPVITGIEQRAAITGQTTKGVQRRRLALVALAVLLISAGSLIAYLLIDRGKKIESVAVMPLVNSGGDPEMEYLADGITEDVINTLSQLPDLQVMSRNAVFRYKGKEVDPIAVARELNVQAVLVGRLEPRGEDLAISLELVDAENNQQLWGARYSRKLADLVRVQAEISRIVSEKLRLRLSPTDQTRLTKTHTDNTEAYHLYLRGRHLLEKRTGATSERSIEYFQKAIALDPGYALAQAELAWAWDSLGQLGGRSPKDILPKAREAVEAALALDESLAEAHVYSGNLKYEYDWDWLGAEREFKRALELNPNSAQAHRLYAHFLVDMKRADEAVNEISQALRLEPDSVVLNRDMAIIFYFARRYDESIEQFHKTLELDMNMPTAHLFLGRAYEQRGLHEQAVRARLKFESLAGLGSAEEAKLNAAWTTGGWKGFWSELIKLSEPAFGKRGHLHSYWVAELYARAGDRDRSLIWLERAYAERSRHLTGINADPFWDDYRSDQNFQDMVRRVGLVP
jgi:TolB-like protein/DNA-binding winged helix-turn-helix (wHTH) protein